MVSACGAPVARCNIQKRQTQACRTRFAAALVLKHSSTQRVSGTAPTTISAHLHSFK